MKLTNCRSQKFLFSKKQQFSPQNSLVQDSSQVCQLIQKLKNLQERQQKTKNMYLTRIQQLRTILAEQNITALNLEVYIKELRMQNQKQISNLEQLKNEIIKEIYACGDKNKDNIQLMRGLAKQSQVVHQKDRSPNNGGFGLLRSINLRSMEKKSLSKSNSRSKLSLFKSTQTFVGKNSQTLLKKSISTRDFIRIQSEYYGQNSKKY